MNTPKELNSETLGLIRVTHLNARQIVFDLANDRARSFPAPHDTSDAGIVAYIETQVANPPAPVAAPRKQSARVVLSRLADTEYTALTTSPVVAIQRALETARIEAVISESDPDFPAFVAGCDALGIIATHRWVALLAP